MPDRSGTTYLIASHTAPDQVLRLASTLRRGSPGAALVLHHDDRRCSIDRAGLRRLGVRLVEPASAPNWGEASLLGMVLRCLRWCLDHTDFDWLTLLSGQDYPLRPIAQIEQSLADSEVDAFIEAWPCALPALREPVDEFAGRYFFRWRPTRSSSLWSLARAAPDRGRLVRTRRLPSGPWIGLRAVRSPFGPGLACHRGSDWFTLSRAAAAAVDAFVRKRPEVLRYYRRTLHPTESFIQTILANDASFRVSGDYRRYTVWGAPNQTGPRVLRVDDVDAMLASGCDFARKFDPAVDRAVLDQLDRRVHPA
jgi:Core-2/I-Branching enzyme